MSIAAEKQQKLPDEELTLDNPWTRNDWWEELSLCKRQHLVQAVLRPASNTGKGHDRCEDQWGAAERPWVSLKARDAALPFLISCQSEDKPVFICQRKWNARARPEDTQLHFRGSPLNTLQRFQLEAKITEIRKAQRSGFGASPFKEVCFTEITGMEGPLNHGSPPSLCHSAPSSPNVKTV